MKPVEPIDVIELFPALHAELISLLRGLDADDWLRPTVAPRWRVRDIVAHLLDTDVRRLSFQRDQMPPPPPDVSPESYQDLVDFLNQLNAEWVRASQRISPRLLVEFLELTGPEVARLFASLDPGAPAMFSVAWAGEEQSLNWFDTAREYTEKWHHQQQIRDAVGAAGLTERKWLHPVLDTFLRGLPHRYRDKNAAQGAGIGFLIDGPAGDSWTLVRQNQEWQLFSGRCPQPAAIVSMDQDTAWRLLTKGLRRDAASSRITITGDRDLGAVILDMLAVMA